MESEISSRMIARRRRTVLIIATVFVVFLVISLFFAFTSFLLVQRENSRRERCDLNLARLYAATVEYCEANGSYPPAFTVNSKGERLHSWRVLLLPFLGEENLYSQIRLEEPWDSEWNRQFWTKTPNNFRCASTPIDEDEDSDTKNKLCAYSCVIGTSTVFPEDGTAVTPDDLVDGASNTILYVERKKSVNWMDPNSELTEKLVCEENKKIAKERENFASWHASGVLVVFCDGKRQLLSEKIDEDVLRLLLNVHDSHDGESETAADSSSEESAEE